MFEESLLDRLIRTAIDTHARTDGSEKYNPEEIYQLWEDCELDDEELFDWATEHDCFWRFYNGLKLVIKEDIADHINKEAKKKRAERLLKDEPLLEGYEIRIPCDNVLEISDNSVDKECYKRAVRVDRINYNIYEMKVADDGCDRDVTLTYNGTLLGAVRKAMKVYNAVNDIDAE